MKPENDALTPTRCDATLGGSASLEGCIDQALTEKMEAGESSKKGRGEYVIEKNIVDELHKFAIKQIKSVKRHFVNAHDFSIVEQARRLLADERFSRNILKTTTPSKSTIANYIKKCALIDAAEGDITDGGGPHIVQKLARYAPKSRSFYAMRAALKWRAVDRLSRLISATSDLTSAGETSLPWGQYIAAFRHAIHEYKAVQYASRDVCLEWCGRTTVPVLSKKRALKHLPDDWRERFLEAEEGHSSYRSQVVLMRFTGLRPAELEKGVAVMRTGDQVQVLVLGAKVRKVAGQEWRKLRLSVDCLPAWFLAGLTEGESRIFKAETGAMRAHLKRVSEKLFPRRTKNGQVLGALVSAYVFRHALATDMYEEDWDDVTIAAVLGESVAETALWYGLRGSRRTKKKITIAVDPRSVETARAVRSRPKFDPSVFRDFKAKA